ncbi:hypothetical protein A2U01_0063078, partial [Trifolium medium]|nr:hypothetical protein [Trifolium medium]
MLKRRWKLLLEFSLILMMQVLDSGSVVGATRGGHGAMRRRVLSWD